MQTDSPQRPAAATPAVASAIYTPPNWLYPFDWQQVFVGAASPPRPGVSRPIEVDIGCGKGAFLLWAARAHPDRNFLGIERLLVRLRKVDKKLQRLGLTNIRLVRLEASYLIAKLIPDGSVAAYHIYFPDPWPKRRHQGHRLFQPAFVADLYRTLQPGGLIHVATDDAPYFEQIQQVIADSGRFSPRPVEELPADARTDFEKEFIAAGKPIYRSSYKRKE